MSGDRPVPDCIVHSDWSVSPEKRWSAIARRVGDGWHVEAVRPVGQGGDLLDRLGIDTTGGTTTLAGFDFPIGAPAAWGRLTGADSFLELLPQLGLGEWGHFYEVATRPEEISVRRPFYPHRPGGTSREQLWAGIGIREDEALRACERPYPGVPAGAACLFWTLGGNQVGKAALSGWELIAPVVREGRCAVWPFMGDMPALLDAQAVVLCETYPATYYTWLGMPKPGDGWSKRDRDDRRALAEHVLGAAASAPDGVGPGQTTWAPEVRAAVLDGFVDARGEDQFDAVVGLLGMIIALGQGLATVPSSDDVLSWEGWILGRPSDGAAPVMDHRAAEPDAEGPGPASRPEPEAVGGGILAAADVPIVRDAPTFPAVDRARLTLMASVRGDASDEAQLEDCLIITNLLTHELGLAQSEVLPRIESAATGDDRTLAVQWIQDWTASTQTSMSAWAPFQAELIERVGADRALQIADGPASERLNAIVATASPVESPASAPPPPPPLADPPDAAPGAGFKVCPDCAEEVRAAARICRFCNHEFEQAASTPAPPDTVDPGVTAMSSDQVFECEGSKVLTLEVHDRRPLVVRASHTGGDKFFVEILGDGGQSPILEFGPYQGTHAVEGVAVGTHRVTVDAVGAWTLSFSHAVAPPEVPGVPRVITGSGDDVTWIHLDSPEPIFRASTEQEGVFFVTLLRPDGADYESVVLESGPFAGETVARVPRGVYLMAVRAAGPWRVEIEP